MSLALVEPIRRAVEDDRVTSLASAVVGLARSGTFADPDLYAQPRSERYARRLVWRDPKNRFVVVAMTWAPGQTAALHDHGGVWGVEVVVSGTMCETAYTLVDRESTGGRVRFERGRERIARTGSAGVLCPPFDYHTFGNVGSEPAHTLHVYGGAFARLKTFVADADGWYRSSDVALEYDV